MVEGADALGGGGKEGSSERRVSRHQNLRGLYISKINGCWGRSENWGVPEGGFAIAEVLALPSNDVEDVQNAVVAPVVIEYTVEHSLRRKSRWEGLHERFSQYPRTQSRIWH